MTDDLIVMRLRSGLDNADKGADGVRELGGVALTMREAAARIEEDAATIARLERERAGNQAALALRNAGWAAEHARAEAAEAKVAALVEALREIAAEASVPVHTGKNGINFKKMYEGWRKIAVERIDIARAAIAAAKGGE